MRKILGAALLCLCLAQVAFGFSDVLSTAFLGVQPTTAFTLGATTDASGIGYGGTVWNPGAPFCTQTFLIGTAYTNSVVVPVDKTNVAAGTQSPVVTVVKQLSAKRVVVSYRSTVASQAHVYIFQRNGATVVATDVLFRPSDYASNVIDFRGDIIAVAVFGPADAGSSCVVNFY
jgi:hypothetical protein